MLIIKTIKGRKFFSRVFNEGVKIHSANAGFSVIFIKNIPHHNCSADLITVVENDEGLIEAIDKQIVYYGISIGRKASKLAVVRNRLKRLIRISTKELLNKYKAEKEFCPFDSFIITWKTAPKHPRLVRLSDVESLLDGLFKKVYNYYNKKLKSSNEAYIKNTD